MSERSLSLSDHEMNYGTTAKAPAAAATGGMDEPTNAHPPPPLPSELPDPPPSYESLNLDLSTRRPSCGYHPEGATFTEAEAARGKDYYDAGDYRQLTACIVLSCIVLWCFNPAFGLVAFVIAVLGKQWASEEDFDRASRYAKISCYISLAGIIVAAIVACILLTVALSRMK